MTKKAEFKVGDKVRVVDASGFAKGVLVEGDVHEVEEASDVNVKCAGLPGFFPWRFEKAKADFRQDEVETGDTVDFVDNRNEFPETGRGVVSALCAGGFYVREANGDRRYLSERLNGGDSWRLVSASDVDLTPAVSESARRKAQPVARGVLDYFADALMAVAEVSRIGGEQHHPGEPLYWVWGKSADHADCLIRHLSDRGTLDTDGASHTAKVAWRALALLQTELENADPELHAKRQAMRDLAAKGSR